MLKVKTFTAKDALGGTGLFAAQDIKKGAVVSRYSPEFSRYVSAAEYFTLSGAELEYVQKYSYPDYSPHDAPPIDGLILCLDNARFSNHSDDANTRIYSDDLNASVASRDIDRGEEISCDYFQFDPENKIHNMGLISGKTFLINGRARKLFA